MGNRTKTGERHKITAAIQALAGSHGPAAKRAAEALLQLYDQAERRGARSVIDMIESAFASGDPAAMQSAWELWERLDANEKERLLGPKG